MDDCLDGPLGAHPPANDADFFLSIVPAIVSRVEWREYKGNCLALEQGNDFLDVRLIRRHRALLERTNEKNFSCFNQRTISLAEKEAGSAQKRGTSNV